MKKRIILTVLPIVCMLTSCTPMTYEFPKVSFDPTTASAFVAGFQVGMSARMAEHVAEERGYSLSRHCSITFEDIAEGRLWDADSIVGPSIYLWRFLKRGHESVSLDFSYGRVESIHNEFLLHSRQQAEEILELHLAKNPKLTLSEEGVDFRRYKYEPNKLAYLEASIKMIKSDDWRIHLFACDRNYSQAQRNYRLRRKIEAIRRRY